MNEEYLELARRAVAALERIAAGYPEVENRKPLPAVLGRAVYNREEREQKKFEEALAGPQKRPARPLRVDL